MVNQTGKELVCCISLTPCTWFERISMLVILLNCVTLGMYQPCVDFECVTNRCKILQMFDDFIFAFFALEMSIKMIAMGVYGKGTYLADSWNRLDFFIVLAGMLEYCLNVENINLTAIRTIRVLRPLRAINRIPSMRILVMLLLDTLPMLGNVLLLCFFVFFIFGIIGVQLWEGILRQRCFLKPIPNVTYPKPLAAYYQYQEQDRDYICSKPEDNGMHRCSDLPPYKHGELLCNDTALPWSNNIPTNKSCVNWNYYYTECKPQGDNPFQGTISFDNIGLAWVAIFLVISLEGWSDIMYYVQDAHSFWDWIYFVLLIVIGSFFMINLCLVVIATQFSETKKREMERMRQERARYQSTSTLASSTNNSEPTSCYAEIVKLVAHMWRRGKRRLIKKYRLWKYRRHQKREQKLSISNNNEDNPTSVGSPLAMHPFKPQEGEKFKCTVPATVVISPTPRRHRSPPPEAPPPTVPTIEVIEDTPPSPKRPSLLRVPSFNNGSHWEQESHTGASLLSPPGTTNLSRRRSSVMFNDVVLLHGENTPNVQQTRNVCSSEKQTQTGEGDWPDSDSHTVIIPSSAQHQTSTAEAMTCQELLALSGALSAALPTGQLALDSLFNSLSKGVLQPQIQFATSIGAMDRSAVDWTSYDKPRSSCCGCGHTWYCAFQCVYSGCGAARRCVQLLVEHKYFQQGILLAILINTLSMGIEYHNQPEELTVIVETSNIIFSAVFACEMLLKVISEGPFGYISNGFNVFDGIIVILSVIELGQTFLGEREGSSGLSVLRTFRLLRILKLVRFMPNLRRQLVVMLRTMDNVAVFFSLLILFIFIFSILGMNLFGCKFCEPNNNGQQTCDRKNFDSLLWALVTVFQILTQEDWNVVLFNGMEKTSHWAALYFVALMTFGNYVLFNLLVAILVEGFSSERREREQRELAKAQAAAAARKYSECYSDDIYSSCSASESDSFQQEYKNEWETEHTRKSKDNGHREKENCWKQKRKQNNGQCEAKCNIQKESQMLGASSGVASAMPIITHTAATPQDSPNTTLGHSQREFNNRLQSAIALYSSSLSIDSIDCSISSQGSGLLKPPNLTINNLNPQGPQVRRSSPASNMQKKEPLPLAPRFQRGYSWKISRPSLKRKMKSSSEPDEDQEVVLNNNNHLLSGSLHLSDHSHCNGGLLGNTIRNNTQCRRNSCTANRLSPQSHSSKSRPPSGCCHTPQVAWVGGSTAGPLTRQSSVSGGSSGSNQLLPPQVPAIQIIKTGSAHNSHMSVASGRDLSVQNLSECYAKPLNKLSDRPASPAPLPRVNKIREPTVERLPMPLPEEATQTEDDLSPGLRKVFFFFEEKGCLKDRVDYSLYIFPPEHP
ncbi:voltage-dependent T-type calcium channel subunit alpha-1G-like [Macrosteles quadrilineatus]|uniref:voltage-dependent T-type calcium channel subunit alpha-1G-like n=1 Tax=Macrosteles quadrilineatus TaxID=74068 RepID=UPI0023E19EA0|nr:voltage-dependent T-type calcium channel subunit alpha-1G-like [Macrosteles quadrilineatus]